MNKYTLEHIYTLEHFFDFVEDEHGTEYSDLLRKLIADYLSEETQKLKDNIDVYSYGFKQALHHIDGYERITKVRLDNYDESNILKANRLDDKIYKWINKPDYFAEV